MNRCQVAIVCLCQMFLILAVGTKPGICLEHKLVSEKAYFSKGSDDKESYTATLIAPKGKTSNPFWLTLYNGYGAKPGFSWVKVFLEPLDGQKSTGETLADEHTFQRTHAKTIDLTGYFDKGPRKITISGSGNKGAYFAWTFTTAKPVLQIFKATKITPGQNFIIHGFGFGLDSSKVKVTVQDQPAKVLKLTNEQMLVQAPEKLSGVSVVLRVQVNSLLSNELAILTKYVPPHLIAISPRGGSTGATLTIRGTNFSRVPEENIVRFGPNLATVVKVLDTGTIVCKIPDLGIGNGSLPLTVTTNGVKSDNWLDFFCGMEMF